jgi:hypothetical protein
VTRGEEPSDDSVIRSAGEAARRLAMYEELRAFTAWLLWESRSVASRLSREAQAAATTDLATLEAELLRFEESCRVWERRRKELARGAERARTVGPPAATPAGAGVALVEVEPPGASSRARTEAALAWSRESRLIAAQAQLHSRAARERATAMKAKARQVSELATRTRTEVRDGAAVANGPLRPA